MNKCHTCEKEISTNLCGFEEVDGETRLFCLSCKFRDNPQEVNHRNLGFEIREMTVRGGG